jgi:hypothetical protein
MFNRNTNELNLDAPQVAEILLKNKERRETTWEATPKLEGSYIPKHTFDRDVSYGGMKYRFDPEKRDFVKNIS